MADGVARFPGIDRIMRATYTTGHGISPGQCSLEFAPQDHPPARRGSLTFFYLGQQVLEIPDCIIDYASLQRDGAGFVIGCTILDRRWKWQYGMCAGRFNIRDKDNEIIPETKKKPAELVELLLKEMGEFLPSDDAAAIPAEPLPEVEWDGDNPADELADLLEKVNCRVMLDPQTGRAKVARYGEGAGAPTGAILRRSGELNPPEAPDNVRALLAPTIVQARLELEAVGLDSDGTIKPIDELSYKPSNGWTTQTDLFPGVTGEDQIKAARATVFRWYRVKIPAGGIDVPNVTTITDRRQVLPLLSEKVETIADPETGEKKGKPPKVYGIYWIKGNNEPKNSTRDENWEVPWDFSINEEKGIVVFSESTKKKNAAGENSAAELFLDVGFKVSDLKTGAFHRRYYDHPTGSNAGTGPKVVSAESEGGLKLYQKRTAANKDEYEWAELAPAADLDAKAEKYAREEAEKYKVAASEVLAYAGLIPLPMDGLNVQSTYTVAPAPEGATCELSRGTEMANLTLSHAQKRLTEYQRRAAARAERREERLRRRERGE